MKSRLFSKGMVLVAGVGFLTACGEPITYPEARTAAECRASYQRDVQTNGTPGLIVHGNLAATVLSTLVLAGTTEGIRGGALNRCYDKVNAPESERLPVRGTERREARDIVRQQDEVVRNERQARRDMRRNGRPRSPLSPGQLPIPNEYPLQPGDHELWVTLTPEQQARAMLFLQDGSTIQSSLEVN
ncbi:MAG: hypothetical protein ACPGUX_09385 [Halocynthiibacter sp.]